jgi:hypothetical protein
MSHKVWDLGMDINLPLDQEYSFQYVEQLVPLFGLFRGQGSNFILFGGILGRFPLYLSYILILLSVYDRPFRPVNLRGRFCNPLVNKNKVPKTRCGLWWRREIGNEVPLFIFR